jgi:DnaJ-class molecular chaperone
MTNDQRTLMALDHDHRLGHESGCQWCSDVFEGKIEVCGECDGEGVVRVIVGSDGFSESQYKCEQCLGEGWIKPGDDDVAI